MRLVLVRHAEAVDENIDPVRPLSPKGVAQARELGRMLSALEYRPVSIWHSGKKRAEETAHLLASELGVEEGCIMERPSLSPSADPAITAQELEIIEEPLLVVGHLPHIAKTCSALLTGDPDLVQLKFGPAFAACFDNPEGTDKMMLELFLGPVQGLW